MELYYPNDEEIEAFRHASENIYQKYEPVWGSELLDKFQQSAEGR
jgi:hypothetical protein